MSEQRIYVACLAAYNNGILHGEWIEADKGVDHIWDGIKKVLATSPIPNAEEWAIHDSEGFGSINVHEWESPEQIAAYAEFAEEYSEIGIEMIAHFNGNLDDARIALEENYHGEHDSEEDFAEQFITECHDMSGVPSIVSYHIDWQGIARDLFCGDFYTVELNGSVHVFSNH